jgi:hypothetical protein
LYATDAKALSVLNGKNNGVQSEYTANDFRSCLNGWIAEYLSGQNVSIEIIPFNDSMDSSFECTVTKTPQI